MMLLLEINQGNKKLFIYYKIISTYINYIFVYNFDANQTEKYLIGDYYGDYNYIANIYNTNYIAVLEENKIKIVNYVTC